VYIGSSIEREFAEIAACGKVVESRSCRTEFFETDELVG
jgi:hypothetical protein